MLKIVLGLICLMLTVGCRLTSFESRPLSAATLSADYERSSTEIRRKYDGKEILVRGFTESPASKPGPGEDQGFVKLEAKGTSSVAKVTCWFSQEQTLQFSRITGNQYLTVKGVFNGDSGVELKFCKLVNIE